jgi:hypothetical protein
LQVLLLEGDPATLELNQEGVSGAVLALRHKIHGAIDHTWLTLTNSGGDSLK